MMMDALQAAKNQVVQADYIINGEYENFARGAANAQLATANAIIALVERLDKMTDADSQALRTVVLK